MVSIAPREKPRPASGAKPLLRIDSSLVLVPAHVTNSLGASVTGLDTLYVADDSSQANGGGIQKWVSNGSTWTKIATFTRPTKPPDAEQ